MNQGRIIMHALIVTALLAAAADKPAGGQAAAPKLDGKWLVVYAEQNGRPINAWEQQQVTVAKNVLSYEEEGKKRSLRLKFGPKQTVTVSEGGSSEGGGEEQADAKEGAGKGTRSGVYIAGRDYFCLSLTGGAKAGAGEGGRGGAGSFILILRRQATRGEK